MASSEWRMEDLLLAIRHSPFARMSDALNDPLPEQPLRPEQQEQERDHVGEPGLDAAADERPPVELAELLADADDEAADDGARDRGEAPEDQHRQGLQGDDLQREGYVGTSAPHDPRHQGDDAGREPDDHPDLVERDADRKRLLVAVRHGAKGAADAGLREEN